ncbi:MAG TPA: ATP-dependent DNA helicase [Nocardioidaceae bacterium]|nr:ATP-dependent DNA helicase [Nocardioidaceae bacterium]
MSYEIKTPQDLQRLMRAEHPLSDQQFAACTAPLEPAVVIAGAGSGKTTLMAARVVWLVATGRVQPDEVLGLTFTTKAAGELATRIRKALRDAGILPEPGAPRDDDTEILEPTVATYNAYAASLLTEHGLRIGHEPDTRVIADASRYQLAARAVARYEGRVDLLSDSPSHLINWVLGMDAQLSEHLCTPEALQEFDTAQRARWQAALATSRAKNPLLAGIAAIDKRAELMGLVESYRDLKRRLGLMEFSDQIELSARLATQRPEVGEAERAKFKVVLLDEYQDTSVAQALLLKSLFGGGHPVTAVGDPNQAIYGWRGASVSNILRFGEDFPRADGSTDVVQFPLSVNRRSDRRILRVANALARPLYAATEGSAVLEPPASAPEGDVQVAVHLTYDEELAALPARVRQAWETVADREWKEIGVLTRDNAHAADVFHALTQAEIPVEIVGLKGLLDLPEVSEVVATLSLLHDLTDNASLLTLLQGPRWAVGARDLALLGRRSRELASPDLRRARPDGVTLTDQLEQAAAGVDPSDISSLCDALDDPGPAAYSDEAKVRFKLLSDELRHLRQYAGEPLLDLVRRIIDTIGIDLELASSVSPAAPARRDNLDLFVKAVAEFQPADGDVSLGGLLAWLEAEDEYGQGLDVATPTDADSVKLLTVHRSKGLEYDAVFLVGVASKKFPPERGRSRWVTGHAVLPNPLRGDYRDLPVLPGSEKADMDAFVAASKAHEAMEELRLGYVALTRARHLLVLTSYVWSAGKSRANGPSPYLTTVRDEILTWGGAAEQWHDIPASEEKNPIGDEARTAPWPLELQTHEVTRRLEAVALVEAELEAGPRDDEGLDLTEQVLVAEWDQELERLLTEAREGRADDVAVPLPSSLSATALADLRDDPAALAERLARPMPRQPSPAARFGTRFHAWVESHFEAQRQELLLDPEDLPGRADTGIVDDAELAELIERFQQGPFAERAAAAIEPPFALVLDGQVVRGRIDAVFDEPDGGFLLVDWKTNREHTADPLQLAIYRVAWSELTGVPLERIRAAFFYVRDGQLVEPPGLLTRVALEEMMRGEE